MKKKKMMWCETPWYSSGEWERVRALVVERDSRAVEMMKVWRCRVTRLPAGVETTLSLLEAHSDRPHTTLSLGTAVNRFLNHISHIGMNTWGLTKLHEAAEKVGVAEWVVQVRHESTHGTMPSLAVLRAALEFSLSWLETNYWNSSLNFFSCPTSSDSDEEAGGLHTLLELYQYLKLYQVWGTDRMSELQSQTEVWSHLCQQWTAVTVARPAHLASLSVKQAVGRIKTDICSVLDRDPTKLEVLADMLAREELLVPGREFLDSLEKEGSEGDAEVPVQLIQIWSEFLSIVERQGGLLGLISRLVERAGQGGAGCELAGGWVRILGSAVLGQSTPPALSVKPSPGRVAACTLQSWLRSPGHITVQLCPLLCQLANLPRSKVQSVQSLLNIMVGSKLETKPATSVFTLSDLVNSEPSPEPLNESGRDCSTWRLVTNHLTHSSSPLGTVLGSSDWSSLWVEAEWSKEEQEEEETVPKFDICPIDWSSAVGAGASKATSKPAPHFYSNSPKKLYRQQDQQDAFRRRKRLKKS